MSRELEQKLESLRQNASQNPELEKDEKVIEQGDEGKEPVKEAVITRNNGIPKGRSRSMIDHRSSDMEKSLLESIMNGVKSYQDPSLHRVTNVRIQTKQE